MKEFYGSKELKAREKLLEGGAGGETATELMQEMGPVMRSLRNHGISPGMMSIFDFLGYLAKIFLEMFSDR